MKGSICVYEYIYKKMVRLIRYVGLLEYLGTNIKKTCVIKIKDHLMFKWYAWTQIGDNNLVLKTATIKL